MKNFPHTWDGREITASMTGWSEYSTKELPSATEPPIALSIQDVLNQIRVLRTALSAPKLEKAIADLRKHINDDNNPHHTNLDDFTQEVSDILYQEYKRQGGTGTLDFYLQSLFYTLRVATLEEMETVDDTNLLVSVKGAHQIIHKHEKDPKAHLELFEQWFPGDPISADPIIAVTGTFGVPPHLLYILKEYEDTIDPTTEYALQNAIPASVAKNTTSIYSGIDNTGVLRFYPINRGSISDWGLGQPLLQCFGTHENQIPSSNVITAEHFTTRNVGLRAVNTPIAPDTSPQVTEVYTTDDTDKVEHSLVIPSFEMPIGSTKTISMFVRGGDCKYLAIRFEDMVVTGVEAQAIYDLENGRCTLMSDMGRYTGSIYKLANGWFRCSFTLYHHIGQRADLKFTFFQMNTSDVLNSFSYQATTGTAGWVWGLQLEDAVAPTPYISTGTTTHTEPGFYYQLDLANKLDINNMTISLQFYNPKYWGREDLERPIFVIVDEGFAPIWNCKMVNTGEIVIERYAAEKIGEVEVIVADYLDRIGSTTDTWCKLVITIDSTRIETKVNDKEGLGIQAPKPSKAGYRLLLGCDQNGVSFNGFIREFTIYDKSATTEELKFLTGEIIHE